MIESVIKDTANTNYQGTLPSDKRLEKYFDLAEELEIPIAYHVNLNARFQWRYQPAPDFSLFTQRITCLAPWAAKTEHWYLSLPIG